MWHIKARWEQGFINGQLIVANHMSLLERTAAMCWSCWPDDPMHGRCRDVRCQEMGQNTPAVLRQCSGEAWRAEDWRARSGKSCPSGSL